MSLSALGRKLLRVGLDAIPKLFRTDEADHELPGGFAAIMARASEQVKEWIDASYILTATGKWLDQHARDRGLYRVENETDVALRERVRSNENLVTVEALEDAANAILRANGLPETAAVVELRRGCIHLSDASSTVTVTPTGTAGTSTYAYRVLANLGTLDAPRWVVAAAVGKTTTGNASLDSTNYNAVSWTAYSGAVQYCLILVECPAGISGIVGYTASTTLNDQGAGYSAVSTWDAGGINRSFSGDVDDYLIADDEWSIQVFDHSGLGDPAIAFGVDENTGDAYLELAGARGCGIAVTRELEIPIDPTSMSFALEWTAYLDGDFSTSYVTMGLMDRGEPDYAKPGSYAYAFARALKETGAVDTEGWSFDWAADGAGGPGGSQNVGQYSPPLVPVAGTYQTFRLEHWEPASAAAIAFGGNGTTDHLWRLKIDGSVFGDSPNFTEFLSDPIDSRTLKWIRFCIETYGTPTSTPKLRLGPVTFTRTPYFEALITSQRFNKGLDNGWRASDRRPGEVPGKSTLVMLIPYNASADVAEQVLASIDARCAGGVNVKVERRLNP